MLRQPLAAVAPATLLALLLGGCAADPAAAAAQLPKFGDPHYQTIWSRAPAADRARLTQSSSECSQDGWSSLLKGDRSTAMKRFNQAWSLNPRNARALWGMAIVQYERTRRASGPSPTPADLAKMDEAALLIEEAAALPSPEASLLNDAAMVVTTRGAMREHLGVEGTTTDFARAEALLRRAEAMEVHPLIYENWAALERHRGRHESAERYAEKARQLRRGRAGG
jgi:tetratricopeptide (TPR) repeat protein